MTTLFTNGNLVDVIGQTVLTGGSILVENGMIKEVGTSIAAPDGAKVVDLGGRTVLPGLFNCHVHMCSDAGTGAKETISDAAVTIRALKNLKTLLNSGVTYIRDAGAPKYIDVDLHDAQLKGEILAPEMQTACRCICMTGGHGHDSGREADGPDDCRRAAREQLKAGANWIKVMATGGVMTKGVEPGSPQLTEEELRAAIEEAHQDTFRRAHKAGVKIALGTDAGTPFNKYDMTGFECILMVENGMTPMEAIQCGTINAAELMDVKDTHGSITPGKKANFAVFEKSPLEDIHAILDCSMTVLGGDVVFEK